MMKKGLLGCTLANQVIVIGIAYCVSVLFLDAIPSLAPNPVREGFKKKALFVVFYYKGGEM